MKLIVEAGSTKTQSVLLDFYGKSAETITSAGINPVTDPSFEDAILQMISSYKECKVEQVYYYGSGCINTVVNNRIRQSLGKALRLDMDLIEVQDDLLAVGRGLSQREEGIIGILGTGSNIGYYNGSEVADGINSCGYLLGDEGSGYKIGQVIYRKYCRDQTPDKINQIFEEKYELNPSFAIVRAYEQNNPRQYIASFAKHLQDFDTVAQEEILSEVFEKFIHEMLLPLHVKYSCEVHLVGSIAFHFQDHLKKMFQKFDILASSFVQSPLEGLIKYHQ